MKAQIRAIKQKSTPTLIGVFGIIRKTSGKVIGLNGSAHSVFLYLECLHEIEALLSTDPNTKPHLILEFSDGKQTRVEFDPSAKQFRKVTH